MSTPRKVLIASDHAGFALKTAIQAALPEIQWQDLGPIDANHRVDYPDYAEKLAQLVSNGGAGEPGGAHATEGILICGSGIGMSIAANKVAGVRAAVVENPVAARLSKEHNNANVLCLGARFLAPEYGAEIAKTWLDTPFSGDERHSKRIQKIGALEKKQPGC